MILYLHLKQLRPYTFLVANYSDAGNEFYLNYNSNKTRYLDSYIAEDGDVAGWILLNFN